MEWDGRKGCVYLIEPRQGSQRKGKFRPESWDPPRYHLSSSNVAGQEPGTGLPRYTWPSHLSAALLFRTQGQASPVSWMRPALASVGLLVLSQRGLTQNEQWRSALSMVCLTSSPPEQVYWKYDR